MVLRLDAVIYSHTATIMSGQFMNCMPTRARIFVVQQIHVNKSKYTCAQAHLYSMSSKRNGTHMELYRQKIMKCL